MFTARFVELLQTIRYLDTVYFFSRETRTLEDRNFLSKNRDIFR